MKCSFYYIRDNQLCEMAITGLGAADLIAYLNAGDAGSEATIAIETLTPAPEVVKVGELIVIGLHDKPITFRELVLNGEPDVVRAVHRLQRDFLIIRYGFMSVDDDGKPQLTEESEGRVGRARRGRTNDDRLREAFADLLDVLVEGFAELDFRSDALRDLRKLRSGMGRG